MKEELLQFTYDKLIHSAGFQESIQRLKADIDLIDARRFFAACKPIRGMLLYLGKEEMEKGIVKIEQNYLNCLYTSICCDALQKYSSYQLKSVMFYLISCSPESYEKYHLGEINYHFVQNICLDMVRDIMLQNFKLFTRKEYESKTALWFSQAFGPGYFGMELDQGRKIHEILHGEKIGVTYKGDMMYPLKSTIGFTFSYQADNKVIEKTCEYCKKVNDNCMLCGECMKEMYR